VLMVGHGSGEGRRGLSGKAGATVALLYAPLSELPLLSLGL
jgi:hypothetical protein